MATVLRLNLIFPTAYVQTQTVRDSNFQDAAMRGLDFRQMPSEFVHRSNENYFAARDVTHVVNFELPGDDGHLDTCNRIV